MFHVERRFGGHTMWEWFHVKHGSLFSFPAHEWSLEVRRTKLDDMFFLIFHLSA